MIVNLLLELVYGIFDLLTFAISIPAAPVAALDILNDAFGYFTVGMAFLSNYVDVQYWLVLFGIILLIDVGLGVYRFAMWMMKKIPVVGVN